MQFPLMLAQSAEQGVGLLQTIIQGGAALILAVVAVIVGKFAYDQLKRNNDLEHHFREKIEADGKARLEGSEKLLREMLDRDREAQEATTAAVQAVEGFTGAMRDQQASCEAVSAKIDGLSSQVSGLTDRIKILEDEARRRT